MDVATQNHLTTLRSLLTYRLSDLRAAVHATQLEGRLYLDEAAGVEAALHRLDTGTYGDCAECGKPISLQRLLVQPATTTCAGCESARAQAPGGPAPQQPGALIQ